jgi:hypothetical protein
MRSRGQLAGLVLLGDLLLPAAEACRGAALVQLVGEGAQQGGRGVGVHKE